jgi:probable rRNA maturation factor
MEDPGNAGSIVYRRAPSGLRRTPIRRIAERLTEHVTGGRRFCCLITSDVELRRLNREYRGKDKATDVLSFPAPDGAPYLGDLAISYERAREQAREHGHALEAEIGVLMLHGVLHLTGMDHESDRGEMRRAEARLRKALGLPASLTERAEGRV